MDPDERQHQARGVVGGQLGVEHDLPVDRHPAAPFGRPVRDRVPGPVQFGEPGLLEGDELLVAGPGLGGAPVGGHVGATPLPHGGPEVVEVGGHRRCENSPVSPRRPTRWVSC